MSRNEEIQWSLQLSVDNNTNFPPVSNTSNTSSFPGAGFGFFTQNTTPASSNKSVTIGNFSNVYINRTFYVRVVATDGGGLSTIISEFACKVVERPFVANQYNVANMILRQAGTGFPIQSYYPDAFPNDTIRSNSGIRPYLTNDQTPKPLPTTADMISFGFSGVGTQYNIGTTGFSMQADIIGQQGQMIITGNGFNYQTGDVIYSSLTQVVSGTSTSILARQFPYSNAYYVLTPSLFNATAPT